MEALTRSTSHKLAAPSIGRIVRVTGIALLRALSLLVVLLFAVPVALLLINTLVPLPVIVLLALANLAAVAALFRFRWTIGASVAALASSLIVAALAITASQAFASTPSITDAQGRVIPGSIARWKR